jgi:CRISPR-associated protein Cas6
MESIFDAPDVSSTQGAAPKGQGTLMLIEQQPLNCVDLVFRANGSSISRDHGYSLYSAVCRIVPEVHQAGDIGIFPIRGTSAGGGTLLLSDPSTLRLRLPASRLPALLPLAGKVLELDGYRVRLGVPQVAALAPAPALASPLVVIKLAHVTGDGDITPDRFLQAVRKQLADLNIQGEPGLQLIRTGVRAGQVRRRVLRIKQKTVVGYAMTVRGLTAEESILLQERGLGGRRLMGCGLFLEEKRER